MKSMSNQLIHVCKMCIEACQKGIDTMQKLPELCGMSISPECAAQLGKSVKACSELMSACTNCIKECQQHMHGCENATCKKYCKEAIEACTQTIALCKKSIEDCRAERGECLKDSLAAVKQFEACAHACQACMNHKH